MTVALALKGVTVGYGERILIEDMTYAFQLGQLYLIEGANGVGKSTLLNVIAGSAPLLSGEVMLGGVPISHSSRRERRKNGIVIMPQGQLLFDNFTVDDNLRLAVVDDSGLALPKTALRRAALFDMFPEAAGLRRQHAGNLSGGQRQLIALVMAFAEEASVLLLDEPLSLLDGEIRHRVINRIAGERYDGGPAIIVVEHKTLELRPIGNAVMAITDRHLVQLSS